MKNVTIFDTTLRDGDGVHFTLDDKIAIATELEASGVDVVEVAVAGASRGQLAAARAIASRLRASTVCVLAPSSLEAIDAAGEALRGAASARIHVFQPTVGDAAARSRAEIMVRRARWLAAEVEYTPANGACADLDAVAAQVRAAIRGGATTINLADTAGRALPDQVRTRVRDLHARVPELASVSLAFHGHDDLGLATANALAALCAGATQVEVAVNGLGARAGNTPLEEIVATLSEHGDALGLASRVDPSRLVALSRLVEARSARRVAPQKAVVGRAAKYTRRRARCG